MKFINYKNELTKTLCYALYKKNINYNYISADDKVLDDEIVLWSGKRNNLKVIVCDSYLYMRDYFKVVKSEFKGGSLVESVVYEGTNIRGIVSLINKIILTFQKRKDFYFKNKKS